MNGPGPNDSGFGVDRRTDSARRIPGRILWFLAGSTLGLTILAAVPVHARQSTALVPAEPAVTAATGTTVGPAPILLPATSSPTGAYPETTTLPREDPSPPPSTAPSGAGPQSVSSPPSPESDGGVGAEPAAGGATPEKRRLRVAVVGDSVGLMMQLNFPPRLRQGVRLIDGTIEGCGVFDFGRVVSATGLGHDMSRCRDFPSRWANRAVAGDADVALVVIGAWETFDLDIDGRVVAHGSPEFDLLFRSGLRRGVDALLDGGMDVILLRVPCFAPPPGSILPERGINGRTAHLNQLLEAAVAEHPDRVSLVDPVPEFCRDPQVASDLSLRWDGVHVGPAGGELIWDRLVELLPASGTGT